MYHEGPDGVAGMDEEKNTLVISAFPGTGKTWCFGNMKQDGFVILDSDSSKFDKSEFPANYIAHIKENLGKADIIFVSSHDTVRDALREEGIEFYVIYPDNTPAHKEHYMKRYAERGSSEAFLKLMDEKWDEFIDSIESHEEDNLFALPYPDMFMFSALSVMVQLRYYDLPMNLIRAQGYNFIAAETGMVFVEIMPQQWCELLNRSIPSADEGCSRPSKARLAFMDMATFADLWHSWEGNKPQIILPEGWSIVPK